MWDAETVFNTLALIAVAVTLLSIRHLGMVGGDRG